MPKKLTIEEMHSMAEGKGGLCLSSVYDGKDKKLRWRCVEGHEWEAIPHHIRHNNTWCPHCARRVPLTIEEAHAAARMKGGVCLSSKVVSAKDKLLWRCDQNHEWLAELYRVSRHSWCPYCAGKHKTLEGMQELAQSKGGKCLSAEYIPCTKLEWQCKEGHTWSSSPYFIQAGTTWCPRCSGKGKTIEDLRQLASSKGGQCLSTKYFGVMANHTWQCGKGHTWEATPLNVRRTSWCPQCKVNKRERACRLAFETTFQTSFPKMRPVWLRNSRGNRMELDGMSQRLNLAFEYQGIQHYEHCYLHKTLDDFTWQQQRDLEKKELCLRHGIRLIEVPWTTPNLETFVRSLQIPGALN